MPFISPGKRRESTSWTARQYTEAIRKYLEAKGYSLFHDAALEGTFPDMVFYPTTLVQAKSIIWVEAKYSEQSIEDEDLRVEIIKYAEEWLKLPPEKRFTLYIFVKRAKSSAKWEKLSKFTDKEFIKQWLQKSIEKSGNNYVEEALKNRYNEIGEFFVTSYFFDLDIPTLDELTKEIEGESLASSKRTAEKDLKSMNDRINVGLNKDKLLGNILSITPPENLTIVNYDSTLALYLSQSKYKLPPFANLSNHELITIADDRILERFEDLKAQYHRITVKELEKEHPNTLAYFFNQVVGRFFVWKGAIIVENRNLYFFPLKDDNSPIKIEGINKKRVQVSKPIFKKNEEEAQDRSSLLVESVKTQEKQLNFGFHKAFQIRTSKIWDKYYISLTIKKLYTKDGKRPVDGDIARKIDKSFRNTLYNTSDSYKTVVLSLLNLLNNPSDRTRYEDGILSNFKIGKIVEFTSFSSPVPVGLNQNVFELEFDESQEEDT